MSNNLLQMFKTAEEIFSHRDSAASAGLPERGEVEGDVFLRRIVDACASGLAVLDEAGAVLYVSPAWRSCRVEVNDSEDGWLGTLNFYAGAPNPLTEDLQRILDGREREFHKEYSVAGDDGPVWLLVHAARLDLPGTNRFRVLVTREDVTRHRQAEEALRKLGGRLIKAQEEERSRVARELHDDLSQQVALMSIELEQLGQHLPDGDRDLRARVARLCAKAQDVSSEIHSLSHQLHPAKLEHLGLAAAVKNLCDEHSEHHQLKIDFQPKGFPAALSREIALCVYRVAQESLQNITKHSGASEAEVLLRKSSNSLHLRVSDNGCGFDTRSPRSKSGLGFISMKERLSLVGGKVSIRSQPFTGTQIDIVIPTKRDFMVGV